MLHMHCLQPIRRAAQALDLAATGLQVDFDGLACAVEALAEVLTRGGIGRGHRVALLAPASPQFIVALLAVVRCGAAAAPIEITLRGLSLSTALERLAPDAVIGDAAILRRLANAADDLPVLVAFEEIISGHAPALTGTARLRGTAEAFRLPLSGHAPEIGVAEGASPDDDALLVSTSGSTGQPKYVRLGHAGTLFNTRAHLASLGLNEPFRALQALDISYSYGLIASLLATLVAGGTLVLPAHNDARSIREAITVGRPTVCLGSPALFDYLIDTCPDEEREVLRRLEKIGIGGDRCREPLRHKIQAALPGVACHATYGTTEAGPRIATLPADQFLSRPLSVGPALEGVELSILDSDGRPCPPGEVGMLWVRTPSRMKGYLGDGTDATPDEWLGIGDLASLDAQGFLTIHGRADRQFKLRGRRVNPAQIELVLERFPGVVAARVEPVSEAGDQLRAVVHHRLEQGHDLLRRLTEHCRRNLPSRLVPGEIVTVIAGDGYFFKGRQLPLNQSLT